MARWESLLITVQSCLVGYLFFGLGGTTPSLKNLTIYVGLRNEGDDDDVDFDNDDDNDDEDSGEYVALPVNVSFNCDPNLVWHRSGGLCQNNRLHSIFYNPWPACPNLKELFLAGLHWTTLIFHSPSAGLVEISRPTYLHIEDLKGVGKVLPFIHAPSMQRFYHSESSDSLTEVQIWPCASYIEADDRGYVPRFEGQPIALEAVNAQVLNLTDIPLDIARPLALSTTHLGSAAFIAISQCPGRSLHSISLPALTSIRVESSPSLLGHIRAPRLESIEVCGDSATNMEMVASLSDLIEHSAPLALHYLSMSFVTAADENIVWCLKRLPLLETLKIGTCSVSDVLSRALSTPFSGEKGPKWLLPRLTEIELVENSGMVPASVIKLIKSRNNSSSRGGSMPPHITG
ncbi:hypothetical protein BOTBODRAFT_172595 [Botryobasidium botryosum FD-172 SS1]|uniref:F-box domain-containing protein n=1 Tax=Botryobasidium botryosum (strain FD-172 SS1) TaxID=930990 RepID=A0A067MZN1_BOTB1|nr:hypothetical protein BOTBODRAFT_172595 [Botryobasidium botryosum FD-172 SS1]